MRKFLPPLLLLLEFCAIPAGSASAAVRSSPDFSWCADVTRIRQMLCRAPDFAALSSCAAAACGLPAPETPVIEPADLITPADAPKGYREQIMILQ